MEEKYLYFRTQATSTSDDGSDDSVCYPLSSFLGIRPGQDDQTDDADLMTLFFKPLRNADGQAADSADVLVNDKVEIKIAQATGGLKEAMEELIQCFMSSQDTMIVVCDDQTSEKCTSLISSVEAITIQGILT
jgi:hypothetical protein|tara:strand:- start:564 stop:962 length:399 start_codon:yes stop_codon:yes gene_type:complete